MAANPNPAHITDAMWRFVEAWEAMEPATVYAGSWGDFKPGYHADWNTIHEQGWADTDYSVELADDQVGGTALAEYGAAVDITFPSAQSGNYTSIRKYSDRVRAAYKAKDPRLKGWREVLCNSSDGDSAADGYDFVGWYERTPDDSHKWHIHFSVLRKYAGTMQVFQAMMSILKGETLAQWQGRVTGGGTVKLFKWGGDYWVSRNDGETRETVTGLADPGGMFALFVAVWPEAVWPDKDENGWPATDLAQPPRSWLEHHVDGVFGKPIPFGTAGDKTGGGGGLSEQEVRDIAAEEAADVVAGTKLTPPPVT